MTENSHKTQVRKATAQTLVDLVTLPILPDLKTLLNPLPDLNSILKIPQPSSLLADNMATGAAPAFSPPVADLPKAPYTGISQALADTAIVGKSSKEFSASCSQLKTMFAAGSTHTGNDLKKNAAASSIAGNIPFFSGKLPTIPSMAELNPLENVLSSTRAAIGRFDELSRGFERFQSLVTEAEKASARFQSMFNTTSLLDERLFQFQRTVTFVTGGITSLTTGIRIRSAASSILLTSPLNDFNFALHDSRHLEGNAPAEIEDDIFQFFSPFLNLPICAIKWLLTNKKFHAFMWNLLCNIAGGMLTVYGMNQFHSYPVSSISNQTLAYRNEHIPDEPLGIICNGVHTLYSGPSKFSIPRLKVFENQEVILHDEESNGWRKVSVVKEDRGERVIYEGWIEDHGYDAIP